MRSLIWRWLERREERKAARRYHKAITAPLSPAAVEYIRKRLEDGTAPRRTVHRNWDGSVLECDASRSGICLNNSEGFEPCDVDEGECIHRTFQTP